MWTQSIQTSQRLTWFTGQCTNTSRWTAVILPRTTSPSTRRNTQSLTTTRCCNITCLYWLVHYINNTPCVWYLYHLYMCDHLIKPFTLSEFSIFDIIESYIKIPSWKNGLNYSYILFRTQDIILWRWHYSKYINWENRIWCFIKWNHTEFIIYDLFVTLLSTSN